MTVRLRLLLPLLVVLVAFAALVAAPSVALAESLSWPLSYVGPPNIPNGVDEPLPVSAGFNAVSFSDSTNGWAVGMRVNNVTPQGGGTSEGLIATTSSGGATWTVTSFGSFELCGVSARGSSNVWVVGARGTIIKWNGSSWTTRTVETWPSNKAFRAVAFTDDSNGWAVGDGLGIAKTTNGGTTWSLVATPGTGATLRSLAALTATSVIAVGDDGTTKVLGTGGVGPTRTIAGVDLYGVSFIDSSTGWAVGDGPTVLRTDNGGATWSPAAPLPLPAPWTEADRAYLAARAVAFTGSMAGMVVGAYQTVWRTPDGGDSWTASLLYDAGTLDDYDLRGVAFTPGSIDGPVVVSRMQYLDSPDNKARAYKGAWAGLVTPTPPAPSGVILAGEGTASRQISWTDNSFTEGGFVLQRAQDSTANVAFSTVATLPANTTSWTDSPVDLGPVFYYRVKSYRGADSSAWATADVTAPTTVSNAKAVYSGSATILLTGTDNVGGSGVDHTYYRLDGGAETTYTAAFSTTKTGAHTLEFWSVDRAGNVESFHTATFTVLIATSVSITSDHTSASYGHAIVFSGHVSSNISTNSHVEVWAKKPGSSTWVKLSTRHSTSTHHWSYTYAPPAKGTWYFQVRYAGTSKYGPSTSSSRAVTVKAVATSVSITSNHTTVTSGHPVVFSGHISSNRPRNTDVKVYAKQPGSSTWVYLSTRHTTSTHHWSYTYAPTIKGTWYFQVRYAGTSKYGASTSSSRKITVN